MGLCLLGAGLEHDAGKRSMGAANKHAGRIEPRPCGSKPLRGMGVGMGGAGRTWGGAGEQWREAGKGRALKDFSE